MSEDFKPDWVSPPGHTIQDLMQQRGDTKVHVAATLGLTLEELEQLLCGDKEITLPLGISLEKLFCVDRNFWFNRESQYRISLHQQQQRKVFSGWEDAVAREIREAEDKRVLQELRRIFKKS